MEIYAVMYADYSDWQLYGYFSTREEAEKYCVKHPEMYLHIEPLNCLNGKEDLSNVTVMYEFPIIFRFNAGTWQCCENGEPTIYSDAKAYPHVNSLFVVDDNTAKRWVRVYVNSAKNDITIIKKIAQDIFYQYLESCNGKPSNQSIIEFNKILRGC